MGDLFRKVDLKVPDHLAAVVTPSTYGWKVGVLDELLALIQHFVQVLPVPLGEYVAGHGATLRKSTTRVDVIIGDSTWARVSLRKRAALRGRRPFAHDHPARGAVRGPRGGLPGP